MDTLFFYGTLCHRPLLDVVLGPHGGDVDVTAAELPGHAVYWVAGQTYPVIRKARGQTAGGIRVSGLTPEGIARLDFYEGGYGYVLQGVQVVSDTGATVPAQVYFPKEQTLPPGDPWSLSDWQVRLGRMTVLAAQEVMGHFGHASPAEVAQRYPSILARAAARVNARSTAPTTQRYRARDGDVEVLARREPYAGFFSVEEYDLRHRRFDGGMSDPVSRAAFISADAATVLPYDMMRDRVLLIEQFRLGPMARGDTQCWSLEAIAGRIDPGESPEAAVRREAMEEAGLRLGQLHRVYSYYPSPGAKSEYIYSYVANADLPEEAAGLGGLAHEGEDIRAHVISFDKALALLENGELENAPLILSVLWLARNREWLRSSA